MSAPTPTPATPTDAERLLALELSTDSQTATWRGAAIAQALADQRARYEAVAAELDGDTRDPGFDAGPDYWMGTSYAAERIRQVGTR